MSLIAPVNAPVSQLFGANPSSIQPNGHTGKDYAVALNTPIHAAGAGTVVWADWATKLSGSNPWWIAPAYAGICVVIDHGNGYLTLYAHFNSTPLNIGDRVSQGQQIGLSGTTGLSTGPHLHFEVLGWPLQPYNGFYGRLNPDKYLSTAATPAPAPAPALKANQRLTVAAVKQRTGPSTTSKEVKTWPADTILDFKGFIRGENIGGNYMWFVGAYSDTYFWSGAFSKKDVSGLADLTPKPKPAPVAPAPAPKPVPAPTPTPAPATGPAAYAFKPDFDFVEVQPAAVDHFLYGDFPAKPAKVVIHQFGTLGVDTIGSTINTFINPDSGRQVSAHFAVSGKRIVQFVSLNDRAYHAGKVGNDYVGIETDPAQDADTIASTKKLLAALKAKYGYELPKILHKDVPGNSTNCGASITLSKYDLTPAVVTPPPVVVVPAPKPVPAPAPAPAVDERAAIEGFFAHFIDEYFKAK